MLSLFDNNNADVVEALNSTYRCLDDLLNIDHPYFEHRFRLLRLFPQILKPPFGLVYN